MKKIRLALLLLMLASTAACTVDDKNDGIMLYGVHCSQEETTIEDITSQNDGIFDIELNQLSNAGYLGFNFAYEGYMAYALKVLIANDMDSTVSEERLYGEGNQVYLEHFNISFDVPEGWNPISPYEVTSSVLLPPGAVAGTVIDILTPEAIRQIQENFSANAYSDPSNPTLAQYAIARPPVDQNNPTACTVGNAAEVCRGYRCIPSDPNDSPYHRATKGVCANSCTKKTGCAASCWAPGEFFEGLYTWTDSQSTAVGINGGVVNSLEETDGALEDAGAGFCISTHDLEFGEFGTDSLQRFVCDTGASDEGICRAACSGGQPCAPLVDPNNGDILLEYQCIEGACIPKTMYTPYNTQEIIVNVQAATKDPNGNWRNSNVLNFSLKICKGCLVEYDDYICSMSGMEKYMASIDDDDFLDIPACSILFGRQDRKISCGALESCRDWYCEAETYNMSVADIRIRVDSE